MGLELPLSSNSMRPKAPKKNRGVKSKQNPAVARMGRGRLREKSELTREGNGESHTAQTTERNRRNVGLDREQANRQRIEEFLRESEERFQAFLDHAPNVAFMKTNDGRYLYVNRRFEEVFHLESQHILGKTDRELFPREQAEQFQANDRLVAEAGKAMEFEETARYTDGLHTSIVVKFPLRDGSGRIYATGGIATEITDRKQNEEELSQNQDLLQAQQSQLQGMTSKLLTFQEEERLRIARELHDDFSQRLAALVLDVASLEQQPPLLPELIGKALLPIREQLEQLSDDIHNLAYKLHPSLLQHAGLQPAIEDHIQKVTERTGLRIILNAKNVPGAIPLDWSTCLFRVLQESLQNIVKHANATEVLVKLSGSSKGIGLSVKDNGRGFDTENKKTQQKGLGLISMQERLRLLSGFLRIHSRLAEGTKLCAWIPFRKNESWLALAS